MKVGVKSKPVHVEKKIQTKKDCKNNDAPTAKNHNTAFNNREKDNEDKRTSKKSNNCNNNSNDLKGEQSDRLQKKQTLMIRRNWSGIYTKNAIFY